MIFLNVDGVDGAGKSTVVEKLQSYFSNKGKTSVYTHFPRYNTEIGKVIKKVLTGELKMNPAALQMLYSADRVNWSTFEYYEYQKNFDVVISDRYTTSGLVYGQFDGLYIKEILQNELRIVNPDIHFILCVDTDIALERIKNRGGTVTMYEKRNTIDIVSEKFKELQTFIPNVYFIDSNGTIEKTMEQVINIIEEKRIT